MPLNTSDRFFACLLGKNAELEKRYGVLHLIPGTRPPMFRLLTKNEDEDVCATRVSTLNENPEIATT